MFHTLWTKTTSGLPAIVFSTFVTRAADRANRSSGNAAAYRTMGSQSATEQVHKRDVEHATRTHDQFQCEVRIAGSPGEQRRDVELSPLTPTVPRKEDVVDAALDILDVKVLLRVVADHLVRHIVE